MDGFISRGTWRSKARSTWGFDCRWEYEGRVRPGRRCHLLVSRHRKPIQSKSRSSSRSARKFESSGTQREPLELIYIYMSATSTVPAKSSAPNGIVTYIEEFNTPPPSNLSLEPCPIPIPIPISNPSTHTSASTQKLPQKASPTPLPTKHSPPPPQSPPPPPPPPPQSPKTRSEAKNTLFRPHNPFLTRGRGR